MLLCILKIFSVSHRLYLIFYNFIFFPPNNMWKMCRSRSFLMVYIIPLHGDTIICSIFLSFIFFKHDFFFFLFLFFGHTEQHVGILVSWLGIKPAPPTVEAQSLNHWTAREILAQSLIHGSLGSLQFLLLQNS